MASPVSTTTARPTETGLELQRVRMDLPHLHFFALGDEFVVLPLVACTGLHCHGRRFPGGRDGRFAGGRDRWMAHHRSPRRRRGRTAPPAAANDAPSPTRGLGHVAVAGCRPGCAARPIGHTALGDSGGASSRRPSVKPRWQYRRPGHNRRTRGWIEARSKRGWGGEATLHQRRMAPLHGADLGGARQGRTAPPAVALRHSLGKGARHTGGGGSTGVGSNRTPGFFFFIWAELGFLLPRRPTNPTKSPAYKFSIIIFRKVSCAYIFLF